MNIGKLPREAYVALMQTVNLSANLLAGILFI